MCNPLYHCVSPQKAFSCCEATNPNVQMKELYGHQISGMFGAPSLPTHGLQDALVVCPGCVICTSWIQCTVCHPQPLSGR